MKLWKWLVGLFFLLVIVDGGLRKWIFPGYPTFFLVLKDMVLWGGFALYSLQRSPTELPRPLRKTWAPVLLGAYIFVVLLQASNLRQPSLGASLVGLKAHLAYLPLVILLPALIIQTTERQMNQLLWGYAICVFLPVVALSVYQFYQPPTAWINTYVRRTELIDTLTAEHVRVTGTFPYIGSYTPYLLVNAFLSASTLLAGLRWNRRDLTVLGTTFLIAVLVVLPMTGSRSTVATTVGAVVALLLVTKAGARKRLRFLGVAAAVVFVVVQGGVGLGLTEGWEAFQQRVERAGGTEAAEGRTLKILGGPIEGLERAGLFGYGVGTAHQATSRFVPGASGYSWLPEGYIENGTARVFIEIGVIGWLVLMALKGTLLYLAYQTVQRSRRPHHLIIGGTAFCMLLSKLVLPVVFNVVTSAFYWGTAGAMLGVWSLQHVRLTQSLASLKASVRA
jgi:hypothetical protein